MLQGYEIWRGFDPDLSTEQYEALNSKLNHIASYIGDYTLSDRVTPQDLMEDLELDATGSYFSIEAQQVELTPWLLHTCQTSEIKVGNISAAIVNLLLPLLKPENSEKVTADVGQVSGVLVECLNRIKSVNNGSDALLLLYAIDVGLLQLISRVCNYRLSKFLSTKTNE